MEIRHILTEVDTDGTTSNQDIWVVDGHLLVHNGRDRYRDWSVKTLARCELVTEECVPADVLQAIKASLQDGKSRWMDSTETPESGGDAPIHTEE